ncbi:hypothetical protein HYPSUDRAFT_1084464 [Hypholoma sublateritium FD-334 SS-4]|uniref:Antifreeze protein n=1 Tax=Hypholoma sublateritium (strain FD-334 SS-4) TaxID=945553 RepID=A0A0D2P0Z7_HYPSF|nr:hypothetical protein HYPSUDRAFT_1084464 [Hypholoma sublateritium FD-334 SS-4]
MFSVGIYSLIAPMIVSVVQAAGPAAINLGTAGNFTILAKSGISTVPNSDITGNIGVSPSSGTSLTGFALTISPSGVFATSAQVSGSLLAADFAAPTSSQLSTAIVDMQTAFKNGTSRVHPNSRNLLAGRLTSQTLSPGLYKWTSGVTVTTSLTLNGTENDVWIFQIQKNLVFATGAETILAGGALSKNVFWVVSGSVDLLASASLEGVILGGTEIALVTGALVNGRIFSQTAVTLQQSVVNPNQ